MLETARITDCTDSLLWYFNSIGKEYSVIRKEYEHLKHTYIYWVRADDGYTNFIYEKDCEVL